MGTEAINIAIFIVGLTISGISTAAVVSWRVSRITTRVEERLDTLQKTTHEINQDFKQHINYHMQLNNGKPKIITTRSVSNEGSKESDTEIDLCDRTGNRS